MVEMTESKVSEMIEKTLQYALGKFAVETKKELETKILATT
jgi:hypothetical protein